MEKRTKHQIKRDLSYRRFMQAALKMFAEKGYEKASIEDIAKEAGYTKGAFYVHFDSKEELFLKLMENRLEDFKQKFFDSYTPEEDLEKSVQRGVALFIELTREDKWAPIYFEFCVNAIRNEEIKRQMIIHYQNWVDILISIFKQFPQFRNIADPDMRQTAAAMIAMLDGYHLYNSIALASIDQKLIGDLIIKLLLSLQHR